MIAENLVTFPLTLYGTDPQDKHHLIHFRLKSQQN